MDDFLMLKSITDYRYRAVEIAQWLRALVALLGDWVGFMLGDMQNSVNQVPGVLSFSSGLSKYCMCMEYRQACRQTPMHKLFLKLRFLSKIYLHRMFLILLQVIIYFSRNLIEFLSHLCQVACPVTPHHPCHAFLGSHGFFCSPGWPQRQTLPAAASPVLVWCGVAIRLGPSFQLYKLVLSHECTLDDVSYSSCLG